MLKKQLLSLLMAGSLFFSFGQSAWASDFFSVGVSVPTAVKADDADIKSVSGAMAYVKLPFLVGIGQEMYNFKVKSGTDDIQYDVGLTDLFYQLPIPIVNITFGIGVGTVTLKGDYEDYYEPATATQTFLRFGIPFGMFDIHVSRHNVKSTLKGKTVTIGSTSYTSEDTDTNFGTTAVGLSFGF
ncbi:MAG: hypothetical protein QNL04_00895 [SAR324 cluster bacterium]|nr:hypothetical protein [SAR324 cluster bacterium]